MMVKTSNDPVIARRREETEAAFDDRAKRESSPVTTSIDLSCFTVFNKRTVRDDGTITVSPKGMIRLSAGIARAMKTGDTVEILLNKAVTIIAVRQSPDGFPIKVGKSEGCCSSTTVAKALQAKEVELPAKFVTEWDENLQAWVGRR